jgi:cytochrome P450
MKRDLPPGPRYPGFIQVWLTQRRAGETLDAWSKRYGDTFTIRLIAGKALVFTSDPALIEQIFTADPEVLVPAQAPFILGEHSVMVLHGEPHRAVRDLLMPSFDETHLDRYRANMEQICNDEFADWPINERFELLPRLERVTINVVVSILVGTTDKAELEALGGSTRQLAAFREAHPITAMLLSVMPQRKPPEKFMRVRNAFDGEIHKHIARAREDATLADRSDVVANLIRARHSDGSELSDQEIRDHVATLLIQGHGSAATALTWCVERLVRHPEILDRLRGELADTNGRAGPYLDAVITETLRLRPPIPVVARQVAKPFSFAGYEAPPKTLLVANGLMLHRREDIYPDPLSFKPERWLHEEPGRWTWIPFGGGARYCLGRTLAMYEMNYVLGRMISEFEFERTPDAPDERMRRRGIGWIPDEETPVVIRARVPSSAQTHAAV